MLLKLLQQSQLARGVANLLGLALLPAELPDQHNKPLYPTTCTNHSSLCNLDLTCTCNESAKIEHGLLTMLEYASMLVLMMCRDNLHNQGLYSKHV